MTPSSQEMRSPRNPVRFNAATRVVSSVDFADAVAEITQWEGDAPTPLVELGDLAAGLGIAKILYKHEGPRFGLGSFKALGGSYAALRVLQREISRGLGRNVSMADIRNGDYTDWAARVTLVSAPTAIMAGPLLGGASVSARLAVSTSIPTSAKRAPRPCGA